MWYLNSISSIFRKDRLVMDRRRVCVRITREARSAARRMRIVRVGVRVIVMVSFVVSTMTLQAPFRTCHRHGSLI